METKDKVKVVNRYIEGVSRQDMNAIKEIFDEQAIVEDPIGSDPHVGMEAIVKFYEGAFGAELKLESTGPVRCAGNAAAFPFIVRTPDMEIEVIDIFEFNENGKVRSMRAYWGPENCTQI
jgi:steroid delta-isomerase